MPYLKAETRGDEGRRNKVRQQVQCDAVLFDMDGTLLNSTPAVNGVWQAFAAKYDLNLDELLTKSHGVQTHMTFAKYLPQLSPEERAQAVKEFEGGIIPTALRLVSEGKEGLVVLPGVRKLLDVLRQGPPEAFAIVTSATGTYGYAALELCGPDLGPLPKTIITADDISKGKPNPDPYLEGAKRVNADPTRCLVVEDAPSGALSGLAAGAKVLGVGTGHDQAALKAVNPHYYVSDLSQVEAEWRDGKLWLIIDSEI